MKIVWKATAVAVCALLMVGAAGVLAQAQNLIANAGFESLGTDGMPADWAGSSNWGGATVFSVDSTVSHSGQNSLKITADAASIGEYSTGSIPLTLGTTYVMSAWIKTDNLTTGGNGGYLDGATLAIRSSYPPGPGWKDGVQQALKGTNGWTYLTRTFTWDDANWGSGNFNVICSFSAWNYGTGTVWFDDLSLQVVPEPSSILALGSGLLGLAAAARRRRAA